MANREAESYKTLIASLGRPEPELTSSSKLRQKFSPVILESSVQCLTLLKKYIFY